MWWLDLTWELEFQLGKVCLKYDAKCETTQGSKANLKRQDQLFNLSLKTFQTAMVTVKN